jgi:hypothetical protein
MVAGLDDLDLAGATFFSGSLDLCLEIGTLGLEAAEQLGEVRGGSNSHGERGAPPPQIPYPSQVRPVETHLLQEGLPWSHLTLRILAGMSAMLINIVDGE